MRKERTDPARPLGRSGFRWSPSPAYTRRQPRSPERAWQHRRPAWPEFPGALTREPRSILRTSGVLVLKSGNQLAQLAQFRSPEKKLDASCGASGPSGALQFSEGRGVKTSPLAFCRHRGKLRREESLCSSGGSPSRRMGKPTHTGRSWSPCARPAAAHRRVPGGARGVRAGRLGGGPPTARPAAAP